jgi:hypothetical protein
MSAGEDVAPQSANWHAWISKQPLLARVSLCISGAVGCMGVHSARLSVAGATGRWGLWRPCKDCGGTPGACQGLVATAALFTSQYYRLLDNVVLLHLPADLEADKPRDREPRSMENIAVHAQHRGHPRIVQACDVSAQWAAAVSAPCSLITVLRQGTCSFTTACTGETWHLWLA